MGGRRFDVVLYGASGFVGRQTVAYLAQSPDAAGLRWAIAGRNRASLETVAQQAGVPDVAIRIADSGDAAALDALARETRVVLSCAGPFSLYGSALVAASVANRCHYVDITGETPWVRDLIDRHHAQAAADGTRIVPCCGFDSVPSDLGAFLLARRAGGCAGVKSYFRMYGGFAGGTLASGFQQQESGDWRRAVDPYLLTPAPREDGETDPDGVRWDPDIGAWVGPFIMGRINTRVVRRSAALWEEYGEPYGRPEDNAFRYQEYQQFSPPLARLSAHVVTAAMALYTEATRHRRTREWLRRMLPKPGEGPSEMVKEEGWFTCEQLAFVGGKVRLRSRMRHQGDPSNRATVRFVCESALALACELEKLPGGDRRGGVLTPATAFGDVLARRVQTAGLELRIAEA